MASILEFCNVTVSFDGQDVVRAVSAALAPGEILGLVGESGSGKTSLIRAAAGLLGRGGSVTSGDILFQGSSILTLPEKEQQKLRGAGIGMIFQDCGASLSPIRTIGQQITDSIRAHRKVTGQEAKAAALEMLAAFRLRDGERIWNSYPFELSGGMNQRVGIAIAMLLQPKVLLADEPTSALDVAVQRQVVEEMRRVRDTFGTSIILVTHDIGVVSALADSVLVLQDGCAMEYGSAQAVLQHPQNDYTRKLLAAVPRLRRN